MLVGLVLGLAIYNAVLLDFPLPLALYRKLIGQSCTLRDLQDMEPTLGKSLNGLLQHEGKYSNLSLYRLPLFLSIWPLYQVVTTSSVHSCLHCLIPKHSVGEQRCCYNECHCKERLLYNTVHVLPLHIGRVSSFSLLFQATDA